MNPRKVGKIGLILLVSGLAIYQVTQLFYYSYSDHQWHPSWAFYVYQIGLIIEYIAWVLVFYTLYKLRWRKKKESGT